MNFYRIARDNTHLQYSFGSRALLERDVEAQEVFLRAGRVCRKFMVF